MRYIMAVRFFQVTFFQRLFVELNKFMFVFFASVLCLFVTNGQAIAGNNINEINSIDGVVKYASEYGVKNALSMLEKHEKFEIDNRTILFHEKIYIMGVGDVDRSVWRISEFDKNKNGILISLPLDLHAYNSNFSTLGYVSHMCPGSSVSSGKKIWSINNDLIVAEGWSCGSRGCSHDFGLFQVKIENKNISNICKNY